MSTKCVYFIGIGGIGMSALARYFHHEGYQVGGYDLTPSPLTNALESEGIWIHYVDDISKVPNKFLDTEALIIYTPAVPQNHGELSYFRSGGYRMLKRSEALGEITKLTKGLCVAGTHGKTTTSSLLAHLLYSTIGCNAFLGGISNNYKTNLLLSRESNLVVIEADEFDRSFHRLTPFISIITSADPDHLDIYGSVEAYRESFEYYSSLIESGGVLIMRHGISMTPRLQDGVSLYTYALDKEADFYASNVRTTSGRLFFRWHYPSIGGRSAGSVEVELGVPLLINVENAVAAMAVALLLGVNPEELTTSLASFRGVYRRFDRVVDTPRHVLIDDYAHHPIELEASIRSVRTLYPERKLLGIFQPHLYSRTLDFHKEFAHSLEMLDEIILLDIYPAREQPIEGVTSELIANMISNKTAKVLSKDKLLPYLKAHIEELDVVLMVGAGDIDRLVPEVATLLKD